MIKKVIWLLHIINWLINYFFCQSLKKSEIPIYYQPVHFSTSNKIIFRKQYSFQYSTCYYMMRKTFKNSSREVHFFVRAQLSACNVDTNEIAHWCFSMILTTLGNFHSCPQIFKTFIHRISLDVCFRELFLTQLKKILQRSSTWFLFT